MQIRFGNESVRLLFWIIPLLHLDDTEEAVYNAICYNSNKHISSKCSVWCIDSHLYRCLSIRYHIIKHYNSIVVTTKIYNVKNCSILYLTTQKIIMKHIEDHLNYDIADFLLIEKIKKG